MGSHEGYSTLDFYIKTSADLKGLKELEQEASKTANAAEKVDKSLEEAFNTKNSKKAKKDISSLNTSLGQIWSSVKKVNSGFDQMGKSTRKTQQEARKHTKAVKDTKKPSQDLKKLMDARYKQAKKLLTEQIKEHKTQKQEVREAQKELKLQKEQYSVSLKQLTFNSKQLKHIKEVNDATDKLVNNVNKLNKALSKTEQKTRTIGTNIRKWNKSFTMNGVNTLNKSLQTAEKRIQKIYTDAKKLNQALQIEANVSYNQSGSGGFRGGGGGGFGGRRSSGGRSGSRGGSGGLMFNGYNTQSTARDNRQNNKQDEMHSYKSDKQDYYSFAYVNNPMQGMLDLFDVGTSKETIFDVGVMNETNKLLLENMGGSYEVFDQVTNETITSMQDLIPAMNAMYASANLTADQVNNTAKTMAKFGSYVKTLTGSHDLQKSGMYYLSRAYQGKYQGVDQYGITDESLIATGKYKGADSGDSYENFMAAVEDVMGTQMEELMKTTQGQMTTVYKAFTRSGKEIGQIVLGLFKPLVKSFNDLNTAMGGLPSEFLLLSNAVLDAAASFNNVVMDTGNIVSTIQNSFTYFESFMAGGDLFDQDFEFERPDYDYEAPENKYKLKTVLHNKQTDVQDDLRDTITKWTTRLDDATESIIRFTAEMNETPDESAAKYRQKVMDSDKDLKLGDFDFKEWLGDRPMPSEMDSFENVARSKASSLKENVSAVASPVVSNAKTNIGNGAAFIEGYTTQMASIVGAAMIKSMIVLKGNVEKICSSVATAINSSMAQLYSSTYYTMHNVSNTVKKCMAYIKVYTEAAVNTVSTGITKSMNFLKSHTETVVSIVSTAMKNNIGSLKGYMDAMKGISSEKISPLLSQFKSIGASFSEKVRSGAMEFKEIVKESATSVFGQENMDKMSGWASSAADLITKYASGGGEGEEGGKSLGNLSLDNIKGTVGDLNLDSVKSAAKGVLGEERYDKYSGKMSGYADKAKNYLTEEDQFGDTQINKTKVAKAGGVASIGGGVISAAGGAIGGEVGGAMEGLGGGLSELGNLVGIAQTIAGVIEPLLTAVANFIGISLPGANVVLLIIMGTIALIKHYWDNICQTLNDVYNWLCELVGAAMGIFDPILEAFGELGAALGNLFGSFGGGGGSGDVLVDVINMLFAPLRMIGQVIIWLVQILVAILKPAITAIMIPIRIVAAVINWIAGAIRNVIAFFQPLIDAIQGFFQKIWDSIGWLLDMLGVETEKAKEGEGKKGEGKKEENKSLGELTEEGKTKDLTLQDSQNNGDNTSTPDMNDDQSLQDSQNNTGDYSMSDMDSMSKEDQANAKKKRDTASLEQTSGQTSTLQSDKEDLDSSSSMYDESLDNTSNYNTESMPAEGGAGGGSIELLQNIYDFMQTRWGTAEETVGGEGGGAGEYMDNSTIGAREGLEQTQGMVQPEMMAGQPTPMDEGTGNPITDFLFSNSITDSLLDMPIVGDMIKDTLPGQVMNADKEQREKEAMSGVIQGDGMNEPFLGVAGDVLKDQVDQAMPPEAMNGQEADKLRQGMPEQGQIPPEAMNGQEADKLRQGIPEQGQIPPEAMNGQEADKLRQGIPEQGQMPPDAKNKPFLGVAGNALMGVAEDALKNQMPPEAMNGQEADKLRQGIPEQGQIPPEAMNGQENGMNKPFLGVVGDALKDQMDQAMPPETTNGQMPQKFAPSQMGKMTPEEMMEKKKQGLTPPNMPENGAMQSNNMNQPFLGAAGEVLKKELNNVNNGEIIKDNVPKEANQPKVGRKMDNPIEITINIGEVDSKDRIAEIVKALNEAVNWDNIRAGRTSGV